MFGTIYWEICYISISALVAELLHAVVPYLRKFGNSSI